MKQKRLKLCAILLLGLGLIGGLQAQTIHVRKINGSQAVYQLNDIKKISFTTDNIMVNKTTGSSDVYAFSGIRNLNFNCTYQINAGVSPANSGTITGVGYYVYGATVTLTASPVTGYKFINWTENGAQVSTSANYSFTVGSARNLVANFSVITFNVTINLLKNSMISSKFANSTYNEQPIMYASARRSETLFSIVPDKMRTLLQYNLSQIPQNAIIMSATLSLKGAGHNSSFSSNVSNLFRVTQPWTYTNATWNNMNNKYSYTDAITIQGTTSGAPYENRIVSLTSMVQYWVNNPSMNYGMMLKLVSESGTVSMQFGTDNNTSPTYRPVLTISYVLSPQKSSNNTVFDEKLATNPINIVTPEEIASDSSLFENNIVISPVPAVDFINVTINANGDDNVNYEIFNSIGVKVAVGRVSMNMNERIGLESLSKGVYFIRFRYKNEEATKKFLILK
jgi:hypothetical protein